MFVLWQWTQAKPTAINERLRGSLRPSLPQSEPQLDRR
jgi:hypothetical protein